MNPLKGGFLETLKVIKKNKKTFFLLFILQLALLISISAVTVSYQIKITENARNIVEPLQQANYNETLLEQGQPFMQDMAKQMSSISENYSKMANNILKLFFLILGFFLVFDGLLWSISNRLVKKKRLTSYWIRFVGLTVIFIIPLLLVGFFWLKSFMNLGTETLNLGTKTLNWVFLIVSYFLLIGYCLLEERFKIILKKMFLIGIKEIHWVMLSLLCILSAVLLSLLFIYFSIGNLWLMVLSGILLLLILIVGKIFLINTVNLIKK